MVTIFLASLTLTSHDNLGFPVSGFTARISRLRKCLLLNLVCLGFFRIATSLDSTSCFASSRLYLFFVALFLFFICFGFIVLISILPPPSPMLPELLLRLLEALNLPCTLTNLHRASLLRHQRALERRDEISLDR